MPPDQQPSQRLNPSAVRLRPTFPADVPALFALQSDPDANRMAATKPRTREAFFAAWDRIFADPKVNARVIELENEPGRVLGGVNVFQAPREGRAAPGATDGELHDCLGYWIAKSHWGRGLASRAVALFLANDEPRRPLHATAARANTASLRVLEKCGFRCTGSRMGKETDRYIACEIAEFVLE